MEFGSGVMEAGCIANAAFAGSVGAALDPASPPPRPLLGPRRWRGGRLEPVAGGGSTLAMIVLD